ncbi:MAG: efflux RND transporter periplasmic adaptor subunit [Opitutaceae bacterium]|nr:efflux RND transporter periplasmic adaptor subunit [Opitutaceae bacterium]
MNTPSPGRRPVFGWWLGLAGLVVAGLLVAWFVRRPPTAVVVAPEVREVVDLVVVSGRLRAIREAAVGAEIGGAIEEALVREGDRVTAGQELARLSMLDYDSQREQARAARATSAADVEVAALAVAQARRDLARVAELARGGVTTSAELETVGNLAARLAAAENAARARLAENDAALAVLERQLAKRSVRAPFAGIVTRRSVEPGQSVVPGTALFLVAEMSAVEIYAETDENNVQRLRVGQPATVIAPAYRDQPFPAKLDQIGPRVEWDRGVIGLRLTPAQPPAFLLPNMTVDVNIEVGRYPQALTLPAAAVLRARDGNYVMLVEGDRFTRRAVKVIGENPAHVALEGLTAGDRVARDATKVTADARHRMTAATP